MTPDSIQAVLAGEAKWVVVHADNAEILPVLADKSVASVLTDPPYEAEAHTLQRRVARNLPGGGGRWQTNPSLLRPSPTASGGGWQNKWPELPSGGWSPFARWRRL